jgi:SAM-dependent methyltransferase
MTNEWTTPEHAEAYLARMKDIPHRAEGEATLLSEVPEQSKRVLDLGCGDGRLLSLVLGHCPNATGVCLDFSPTMLEQARSRFAGNDRVTLVEHNLDEPLRELDGFDCVVSSFAIHHCTDERKRGLYAEVFKLLEPGGIFCNLEHVSSPNERIHGRFVEAMKMTAEDEDPSNKLLDVETQLRWLKETGFEDVDCYWKWRELALLIGLKPNARHAKADLESDEKPTPAEVRWLGDQLDAFNKHQVGRDDFTPLNLVIREHGNVIAGLNALTVWDWLYVQVLWVHESHRRTGVGSRLLERAEHVAQERSCIGSCLSTFSFQAPDFYKRQGYSAFGQIDNYPDHSTMYFMSKRFDASK